MLVPFARGQVAATFLEAQATTAFELGQDAIRGRNLRKSCVSYRTPAWLPAAHDELVEGSAEPVPPAPKPRLVE